MTDPMTRPGDVEAGCEFVPPNEPWSCRTHPGGLRTRLDETLCDVARPAEPFNDAYLDNIRASLAEGKKLPGHYMVRRLLATLDAARAAHSPAQPVVGGLPSIEDLTDWLVEDVIAERSTRAGNPESREAFRFVATRLRSRLAATPEDQS